MNHHKKWVSETFDRTALEYGKKSASFFSYFGKRLVELNAPLPGQHVLDIATGRGAVLFPLAEAVGPTGNVVGIDISQEMILETSKEAAAKDLHWIELSCMDAEQLDFPDHSFDSVFCGFSLFFFPSIPTALSECKRVLKPGGKLIISTWGKPSLLKSLLNQEIQKLGIIKDLTATPLSSELTLSKFLEEASFRDIQILKESRLFPHRSAEEWWESLWSHGTRARFEQLSQDQLEALRKELVKKADTLAINGSLGEELHTFYAIAQKPSILSTK